ncbi:MAG TPA: hypothetical protein DCW29_13115 [Janthinobacterium sp.]|nr:hypothetical protein [Janthinobacterium sp.]
MLGGVKTGVRAAAERWLFQLRERETGEVILNMRRVFIVPTRAGLGYALLLLILFIGAINYSLGLGFALTFFMAACGLVDMYMTARNLALLHLAPGRAPAVFAGQEAVFELFLINRGALDRFAVHIDFIEAGQPRHITDVGAGASAAVQLATASGTRGWRAAPRVRLQTRFPLGLFKAWAYWQPDVKVLVYPRPEEQAPPLPLAGAAGEGAGGAGEEHFAGIRAYRTGDSMRHLAWRQIARFDAAQGGQLLSKHFEGGAAGAPTLDFAALPRQLDLEVKLARMTRWVLDAERAALPYAFRLGATHLQAALGEAHQDACLRALALYGSPA